MMMQRVARALAPPHVCEWGVGVGSMVSPCPVAPDVRVYVRVRVALAS